MPTGNRTCSCASCIAGPNNECGLWALRLFVTMLQAVAMPNPTMRRYYAAAVAPCIRAVVCGPSGERVCMAKRQQRPKIRDFPFQGAL